MQSPQGRHSIAICFPGARIPSPAYVFVAGVLLLSTVAGCGGRDLPDLASVTGTVEMDGKPLADATVMFIPESGRPSSGTTDSGGNYTMYYVDNVKGVVPGKCRVLISTGKPSLENEDGEPTPGAPETVPAEYNIDSTLSFEVKSDEDNVASFTLTGGGNVLSSSGEDDAVADGTDE
ncbi:MAG: carboxypeptidase regulatory-like domain-containing protein [Planctomycetaceae bacterium]|nr:carboxypeptidase regulatory-like domain-containing protein [Planctomycetaceae bacterium]